MHKTKMIKVPLFILLIVFPSFNKNIHFISLKISLKIHVNFFPLVLAMQSWESSRDWWTGIWVYTWTTLPHFATINTAICSNHFWNSKRGSVLCKMHIPHSYWCELSTFMGLSKLFSKLQSIMPVQLSEWQFYISISLLSAYGRPGKVESADATFTTQLLLLLLWEGSQLNLVRFHPCYFFIKILECPEIWE